MRRHYQVVIVACCFLLLFANQGLPSTSFGVYQTYLVRLPGVGDLGASLVITVRTLVSLLAIFFVTALYRRFSLRVGAFLMTLCTAGGFLVYGLAGSNLGLLCLGSCLTGVGYGMGGMVASTTLIGNWFHGDVGTAAGVAGVGSGVAGMVIPVAAAAIVRHGSLADAFFFEAALALAIGLTVLALVRSDPAELGLKPFTVEKKPARGGASAAPATRRAPLTRRERVLMMVAVACLGALAVSANYSFSVLLTSEGYAPMAAAALTSVVGASLTAGKFLSGRAFDRLGSRRGSNLFFAALVVGTALCVTVGLGVVDAALAAVLFGAGCALSTTGLAVWALEFSSPEEELKNVRNFEIAYALGGFAFNPLPGVLKTLTGTYTTSFAVFAVCALVAALAVGWVYRARAR